MNITDLRFARSRRSEIIHSPLTTPVQRAQANADFYAAIRLAHAEGMPNAEIQEGAMISRQRLWQIVRTPRKPTPAPTTVQLPEWQQDHLDVVQQLRDTPEQPTPANYRLPETDL